MKNIQDYSLWLPTLIETIKHFADCNDFSVYAFFRGGGKKIYPVFFSVVDKDDALDLGLTLGKHSLSPFCIECGNPKNYQPMTIAELKTRIPEDTETQQNCVCLMLDKSLDVLLYLRPVHGFSIYDSEKKLVIICGNPIHEDKKEF